MISGPVRILLPLLAVLLLRIPCAAQIFDGSVYISTADHQILRIDSLFTNPTETIVCSTPLELLDIAFTPDHELYGVYGDSPGFLCRVQSGGQLTELIPLPCNGANALTFDAENRAYIGFGGSSCILRMNPDSACEEPELWHDFGSGYASGDMVLLNGNLYLAWALGEEVHLLEAILGPDNTYISHRDLGKLPAGTYGLTSNRNDRIIGVTRDKQIFWLSPPADVQEELEIQVLTTFELAGRAFGASCLTEAFGNTAFDFGDAPESYSTADPLMAASHRVIPGLCLGSRVDAEAIPSPADAADGDDANAPLNDEEGVLAGGFPLKDFRLIRGCSISLQIRHSGNAYLNAWFDWNGDRQWSESEHILHQPLTDSLTTFTLDIPADAVAGATYARFRYSSAKDLQPTGPAPDGEVEDYRIRVAEPGTAAPLTAVWLGSNGCVPGQVELPLSVSGFNQLQSLQLQLPYDTRLLSSPRMVRIHPALAGHSSITTDSLAGTLSLTWQSETPLTIPDGDTLLVAGFRMIRAGTAQILPSGSGSALFAPGCGPLTVAVEGEGGTISLFSPPDATLPPGTEHCEGVPFDLSGEVTGERPLTDSWWHLPDHSVVTGQRIHFEKASPDQSGVYTYFCTDMAGCSDSASTVLHVKPAPRIDFAESDTIEYSEGFELQGSSEADYCRWSTGDIRSQISVQHDGEYRLTASLSGCESTDSVYLRRRSSALYLPNAFSPNNDTHNDILRAIGPTEGISSFSLQVFSRWDNLLFETHDPKQGWDGTFQGQACPPGTYICQIKYCPGGTGSKTAVQTLCKTVSLIR
jgi:gliding motility-associated-like protein